MKRRDFLKKAGVVAAGATLSPLMFANAQRSKMQWSMVTSWPRSLDNLFGGAQSIADRVKAMTNGDITIQVYEAGAQVGGLEVYDAVSSGAFEMGHTASYYYIGKDPSHAFFTTVPFGLTPKQINSWIESGGGQELWDELSGNSNLKPLLAGNTGQQMAGWFNKEINKVEDLEGLKMRIPGLGGEVLQRAGGTPVSLPGGEIFTSLESGNIDATEWVGPYNDLAFGLYKAAKYYYYPGWHEPGTTLECFINREAFEELPKDLQSIVINACRVANQDMLAEYTARNNAALHTLVNEHNVDLRRLPAPVIDKLKTLSDEVVAEIAENDAMSKKVYESFKQFRDQVMAWQNVSERAYLNARAEPSSPTRC